MKICVISPLFALAGVPLAQLRFARALASVGYDVDLVFGRINEGYVLPDVAAVNVIVLDRPNVRSMFWPIIRYLRRVQPDVVFSAEDHLNVIVLGAAIAARSKARISGSSRVTPFDTYSNIPFSKRWILKQLSRAVTWRADALTCVSEDMVGQYQKTFKNPPHVCVYNIVKDNQSLLRMKERLDDPWFSNEDTPILVAAGRLAPWKGFGDLIRAMRFVMERRKTRLMILGDGPLRQELQALITKLELQENVRLVGYVENPLKYFARAKVFVLSSHVEGLPNVLVEAMMCGCTPVATDCPTGPREVLQDGKYGYLTPVADPERLAERIVEALDRPVPRELLQEAVRPFEERSVLRRHFEILGLKANLSSQLESA
jgi:glycosyltransferase involved in cell wall biosynthesis